MLVTVMGYRFNWFFFLKCLRLPLCFSAFDRGKFLYTETERRSKSSPILSGPIFQFFEFSFVKEITG